MFGDDPDPTVMTVRVGFGGVSDTHERGLTKGHGDKGFDGLREGREESGPVDLRGGQQRQGRSGNYERLRVLRKHADAMRMML